MTVAQEVRKDQGKKRPRNEVSSIANQERAIVPPKSRVKRAAASDNRNIDSAAMKRALEIEASLPRNFPTMIKLMLPSHVCRGFWLGVDRDFRTEHMHREDMTVELEDEDGEVFSVNYIANNSGAGLSGGWRRFSISHKLVQGDVVIFQLVKPTKFKVCIVRARDLEGNDVAHGLGKLEEKSSSEEVEGALDLMELDRTFDEKSVRAKKLRTRNKATSKTVIHDSDLSSEDNYEPDESEDVSDLDFGFDILDGITMPSESVDFQQVKSFDDFDVIVNGLVINPELSKHLQLKYYELCCSQKSFLHERILGGLNLKLIAGVIAETINIADAIQASKLGRGPSKDNDLRRQKEDFVTWESTLCAFQKLGMNVEFMLIRLRQLMQLSDNAGRCKRLKTERVDVQKEVEIFGAKLEQSERRMRRISEEIKRLEADDHVKDDVKFRKLATAPWSTLT